MYTNRWVKSFALCVLSLMLASTIWAEVPVVEAESVDNTLAEDNFNVVPPPMAPPSKDEVSSSAINSNSLPNSLPSKSLNVSRDANTSMLLLSRIDDLEKELQTLRGQIEDQNHKIEKLEGKVSLSQSAQIVPAPSQVAARAPKKAMDFPHYFRQGKPSQAHDKGDEKSYLAAYNLIKRKQFSEAISSLSNFIESYPSSAYLANAHYWLGELYLAKGELGKALGSFDTVIRDFPLSNKVAGAMLKKGFVYFDKSEWPQARQQLLEVRAKYPDTTLSRLAGSKLSEMDRRGV